MALRNDLFDEIMHGYDVRRLERDRLIMERRRQLCENVSGYRELDMEAEKLNADMVRARMKNDSHRGDDFRLKVSEIRDRQRELLIQNGYDPDYLNPPYQCPKCRDTGFVDSGEQCSCLLTRKRDLLYDQSNIKKVLSHDNFQNLSYDYYEGEHLDRFRKAVSKCREFCDSFSEKQMNLFFYGTPGCGKSFLSCCVAEELLKKDVAVIYYSSQQFFDALAKQTFDRDDVSESEYALLDIPLLIIDDLGSELKNSWSEPGLFTCINTRQIAGLQTIISTNLNLDDLRDRYGDRIFSRIMSNYEIFLMTGPDIRMVDKRRRMKN
nr:ATP-binding protein [Lachnospiraceae bacterium]